MQLSPFTPSLWCGTHGRYEPTPEACPEAFDPEEVDWFVRAEEVPG